MNRSVILHNIRSTYNVGAILRTCDGMGITHVIVSGYTPYPSLQSDDRLPHIHQKLTRQIQKSSLGAESGITIEHTDEIIEVLTMFKNSGTHIIGLEQDDRSILLDTYTAPTSFALLLGEEVAGIEQSLRDMCDDLVEIPMLGQKESFNVSVAAGIALYQLTRR